MMLKKSILLVVVLALSSMLLAQHSTAPASIPGAVISQDQAAADAPETSTCSFVYSSGSGEAFTRYCLSVNGNVVQLDSPSGFEYINAGVVAEGYGVCDITGGASYFDYANTDSGNWGATSVVAPNATTRKFTRITNNGIWQLTQTIKQNKATAKTKGSIAIAMAIKNLTGISRDIFLLRYADLDAAGTNNDDEFNYGNQSAYGQEHLSGGLVLTNNTFSFPDHFGATWSVFSGPDPCSFNVNRNFGPFVGDGSLGHLYHFSVPAGATKTVNMIYRIL